MKRMLFGAMPVALLAGAPVPAQQTPAVPVSPPIASGVAVFSPTAEQVALIEQAKRVGATDVTTASGPDGGMILGGKLDGRRFSLGVPRGWNRQLLLFAGGYATPGAQPTLPDDPIVKDPAAGMLRDAYGQGFAAGVTIYDKNGIGTETATRNLLALRAFAGRLGASRAYLAGGSMGGNIVLSLIEQHPRAFVGATALCGVTHGWLSEIGALADMRAAYTVLTAGTRYALPGGQDVTRSGLPVTPPPGDTTDGDAFRTAQKLKLAAPVLALFTAARTHPDGPEARIIRQAAAIGGFAPDVVAVATPLYVAALGMDDIVATMGGLPVGNVGKLYRPVEMTAAETAAFNAKIQRFQADPRATAYARKWHEATGRFSIPLVTVHQTIDSLVPFSQSEALGRIVARAGNGRNLVQYAVPPTRMKLPIPGDFEGYTHCGFTSEQGAGAFRVLRSWVETGKRPAPDAIK